MNFGAVSPFSSGASVYGQLSIRLTEPVNYSVTGSFLADLNEGVTARTGVSIEPRPTEEFVPHLYIETDDAIGSFTQSEFGDRIGSMLLGTSTGILQPGGYLFIFTAEIRNGNGGTVNSDFAFTLPLPDAGSTLTLLGLAICAIGGIFGKWRALSNC